MLHIFDYYIDYGVKKCWKKSVFDDTQNIKFTKEVEKWGPPSTFLVSGPLNVNEND